MSFVRASALRLSSASSAARRSSLLVARIHTQSNNNNNNNNSHNSTSHAAFAALSLGAVAGLAAVVSQRERLFGSSGSNDASVVALAADVDVAALRSDIVAALASNPKYDDGSYGPVLVRLAWHAAGTYDKASGTGGSDGATMRFEPESKHGANAGLDTARALLAPIGKKYPNVSTADLWQFAAVVAIEEMGGPKIPFRFGRVDKSADACTPDGRLPDATKGADHLRSIFYRMGFNDQEIVALSGAHSLGRCHTTRSGFDGPWQATPTAFNNEYFRLLLEEKWTVRQWKGPLQYEDGTTRKLMMLPTDLTLIKDAEFRKWVEVYAKDEEKFFKDFAAAYTKLIENNVAAFRKPWYQFW
jgi:cytochrome c peroxidase